MAEPGVSDKLNAWLDIICDVITEKHISLLETSHLFLEIDRDIGACNYYFVDHVLRTVFWLHTLNTISVGRSLAMSNDYLRMFLVYPFAWPRKLIFASRARFAGQLLDSCGIVPRDRFSIFLGGTK